MLVVVVLVVICLARGEAASASEPAPGSLTEEEAVRIALGRSAVGASLEARVEAARAAEIRAGAWPNPEVGYEHEHLFDAEVEDAVTLSQTVDLAGKRGAHERAAEQRTRQVEAENDVETLEIARLAKIAFHTARHAGLVRVAVARWEAGLEAALEDAVSRAGAGDASEYERLRLEREAASARAIGRQVAAREERAWRDLEALLGIDTAQRTRPELIGESLSAEDVPGHEEVRSRLAEGPDAAALAAEVEVWRLERRAAGRAWFPDIDFTVGYRTASGDGARAHGFLAGVELPLPIFDSGRGSRRGAEAGRRLSEARQELGAERLLAEALGWRDAVEILSTAAEEVRAATGALSERLLETASAAYAGGEIGVLELVDAHERFMRAEVEALELELAARVARIELCRRIGGEL